MEEFTPEFMGFLQDPISRESLGTLEYLDVKIGPVLVIPFLSMGNLAYCMSCLDFGAYQ